MAEAEILLQKVTHISLATGGGFFTEAGAPTFSLHSKADPATPFAFAKGLLNERRP